LVTDRPPRKRAHREQYERSDALKCMPLPDSTALRRAARKIEDDLAAERRSALQESCSHLAREVVRVFEAECPEVRVLSARPRRIYGDAAIELYGDYEPESARIRVWMRTAVHKRVTSPGTFLSTLCHELCHHLDVVALDLEQTPHTRGFYERAALLYHAARGTPVRPLAWIPCGRGQYRIDWRRLRAR
jgi:hypothetical protein